MDRLRGLKWRWKNRDFRPVKAVKHATQRVRRGYSDRDWWNFEQYLARVIADGCQQFRDKGMGYPSDLTEAEWDEILAQIEHGFREYTRVFEIVNEDEEKRIVDEMQEAGELLIKWFPALWD